MCSSGIQTIVTGGLEAAKASSTQNKQREKRCVIYELNTENNFEVGAQSRSRSLGDEASCRLYAWSRPYLAKLMLSLHS